MAVDLWNAGMDIRFDFELGAFRILNLNKAFMRNDVTGGGGFHGNTISIRNGFLFIAVDSHFGYCCSGQMRRCIARCDGFSLQPSVIVRSVMSH